MNTKEIEKANLGKGSNFRKYDYSISISVSVKISDINVSLEN